MMNSLVNSTLLSLFTTLCLTTFFVSNNVVKQIVLTFMIPVFIWFCASKLSKMLTSNKISQNKVTSTLIEMSFQIIFVFYNDIFWKMIPSEILEGCFSPNTMTPTQANIYSAQSGLWVFIGIKLICLDHRNRDYYVMLTHHCVTLGLIILSRQIGMTSIGLYIMFIHDVVDIFIGMLKISSEITDNIIINVFTYVITLVSWMYFRIFVLGVIIYQDLAETFLHKCLLMSQQESSDKLWSSSVVIFGSLILLHLMRIYWLYILIHVGLKLILSNGNVNESKKQYSLESKQSLKVLELQSSSSTKPSKTSKSTDFNHKYLNNKNYNNIIKCPALY